LLVIFTALSPFYVEQPHYKGSALYKYPTNRCKNNLKRSTDPKFTENFYIGVEYSLLKISVNKTFDDQYSGSYNNVKDLSFVIGWVF
jgi:hypothetical protein